jgi:hypothetical protein
MSYGITERDFWQMSIAEIERAITAKKKAEQRKASFDYVLADLIGRSVARAYNSENTMPTLAQAYPTLFDRQEEEIALQKARDELSVLRFKQFANSINKKKGGQN